MQYRVTHNIIFNDEKEAKAFLAYIIGYFMTSKYQLQDPIIHGHSLECSTQTYDRLMANGLLDKAIEESV